MRGYFGIGVEGVSKSGNVGALLRTAHAFDASFAFTVGAWLDAKEIRLVDTSDTGANLPVYTFPDAEAMRLPQGCTLVGVELLDDAVELPSFRHPARAAYILGPERGSLTPPVLERCAFTVKIPTRFCVNLAVAAAVVMYDRMICLGRFAERPVRTGGPTEPVAAHVHGKPIFRAPPPWGSASNRPRRAKPGAGAGKDDPS